MTDTTPKELELVLRGAAAAARDFGDLAPDRRSELLHDVARIIDEQRDDLVAIAERETHLPTTRLVNEVARTTGQLRFLGHVIRDGGWLRATIDTADPVDPVLRPDVRSMQVPLGVALVFSAGNFPFAFSVAGGDTASALAAGCPVLLKAHPGHPELSARVADLVKKVVGDAFWLITGFDAGRAAIVDPRVKAAAFTGSLTGGRALHDLAANREDPIPFYGELGSVNPVFVTQGALRERADEIADGYVASFTQGSGQLCTKPGLMFVPKGHGLEPRIMSALHQAPAARMLEERLADAHAHTRAALQATPAVEVLGETREPACPAVLTTTTSALTGSDSPLLEECFGPTSVIVEYDGDDELIAATRLFDGSLTATIHSTVDEHALVDELVAELRPRAGRLIWNGWPTGVRVTWAMQHGGPWPASTSSSHTSVGAAAVDRFTRPVAFQDAPDTHLPLAVRDHNQLGILRRVNGSLTTSDVEVSTTP